MPVWFAIFWHSLFRQLECESQIGSKHYKKLVKGLISKPKIPPVRHQLMNLDVYFTF